MDYPRPSQGTGATSGSCKPHRIQGGHPWASPAQGPPFHSPLQCSLTSCPLPLNPKEGFEQPKSKFIKLFLLKLLSGTYLPQIHMWLTPSPPSNLCSNVTFLGITFLKLQLSPQPHHLALNSSSLLSSCFPVKVSSPSRIVWASTVRGHECRN